MGHMQIALLLLSLDAKDHSQVPGGGGGEWDGEAPGELHLLPGIHGFKNVSSGEQPKDKMDQGRAQIHPEGTREHGGGLTLAIRPCRGWGENPAVGRYPG